MAMFPFPLLIMWWRLWGSPTGPGDGSRRPNQDQSKHLGPPEICVTLRFGSGFSPGLVLVLTWIRLSTSLVLVLTRSSSVLSSWRVASHHGPSAPVLPPVVDFVALNQDAVKSGIVTAKQLSQYRARRPCRPQRITEQQRRAQPITEQQRKGLVPDIVFGLTNRWESRSGPGLSPVWSSLNSILQNNVWTGSLFF